MRHMYFCWFAVSAAACEVAATLGTHVTCVAPSSTGHLVASVALLVLRAAALRSTHSEGKPGADGRLKLSSALAAKPPPLSAFAVPVRTTGTHHSLGGSAQQRLPACLPVAAQCRYRRLRPVAAPHRTARPQWGSSRRRQSRWHWQWQLSGSSTCCSFSCSCSGAAGLLELKRRVE